MTDRSKEVFGNVQPEKVQKKAEKSKAKYARKFGDDSAADYPVRDMAPGLFRNCTKVTGVTLPDGIRREWFEDYVQTLIARDVKNVAQIRKVAALGDIVRWLLARSSKLWTMDDLCSSAQITKETAANYVCALEALYIIDKVPAWNKTDYDRIGKSPKGKTAASPSRLIP